LRGKILRIRLNEDGTYSIPDGNLFPKGEPKTRPEIFVMGNRNPYRISVDSKTGWLYWGEVGPDAGTDDSIRGPRGYDEINQAKQAGFYGWPYFIGNNIAYAKHNFATKTTGAKPDPAHPLNDSPNNTGKRELPPSQSALIWYPYDKSDDFPMTKDGSRNAMAGPIYYSENYKDVKTAFPDYLDGKVMIYDWMRNWMFLVTLNVDGNILDMEPFMQNTKFNNIIDMAYGPDGRLYMLEYGSVWFKQNMDARLVRIDYNGGNRAPVIQLAADQYSGAVPLTVNFNANGSLDYDGDELGYELQIGDQKLTSSDGKFKFTFDKPGIHNVRLTGKDDKGLNGQATIKITAGNTPPQIDIAINGNQTFFFPGSPVRYDVKILDKEDGTSDEGKIDVSKAKVTFDFIKGLDATAAPKGHQVQMPEHPGKVLIDNSDCKSCHLVDQKSAGPGYKEIATVYKKQQGSTDKLAEKIIRGGAGVWGSTEMAAHPQLSVEDARKMVEYIFTLTDDKVEKTLPLRGVVVAGDEKGGAYVLAATYTDQAQTNVPSLSARGSAILQSPELEAYKASVLSGPRRFSYQGRTGIENVKHNSHVVFKDIDVSGIRAATAAAFIMPGQQQGGQLEMRLDKPDGPLWAQLDLTGEGVKTPSVKFEPQSGVHDVYFVFKNPGAGDKDLFYFQGVQLRNK
jgi:cytochrome c